MTKRKRLVTGHLERVSGNLLEEYSSQIRELIRNKSGIYALYKRSGALYYVGLASNLSGRLKTHQRDKHNGKWHQFSVYVTAHDGHMRELEAMLIRITEPPGNKQKGKFVRSLDLYKPLEQSLRDFQDEKRANLLGGTTAKRQRRKKAKRASKTRSLAGIFQRKTQIRRTYKGREYRAYVLRNGKISCDGDTYDSLSAAARAIVNRQVNGWAWWKYKDPRGNWVPMKELRKS